MAAFAQAGVPSVTRFMLLLSALLLACVPASAHEQGRGSWINHGRYYSAIDGSHCCGDLDCAELHSDAVTETAAGLELHGTVTYGSGAGALAQRIDETVPHREVQWSRDGNYWRCKKPDGSRRCFFAPPPGS